MRSPKRRSCGGREAREKPQDRAFMYSRCFEDLDGHIWEPLGMHPGSGRPSDRGFRQCSRLTAPFIVAARDDTNRDCARLHQSAQRV